MPLLPWREREGVEPTVPTEGTVPTDFLAPAPGKTRRPGASPHQGYLVQRIRLYVSTEPSCPLYAQHLRGHHRYHQYEDSLGQDDVGAHSVSLFENAKYAISRDGIFAKISGYHGLGAGVENAEVFERPWSGWRQCSTSLLSSLMKTGARRGAKLRQRQDCR